MADSYLGYQNPSQDDKKLDSESVVVGANTVERERIQLTGRGATDIATVDGLKGLKTYLGNDNEVEVSNMIPAVETGLAKDETLQGVDTKIGEVQATPTANTILGRLKAIYDAIVGGVVIGGTVSVSNMISPVETGLATQATLASVLAKLSADPATQTTLAAVLAKIIAAPATEAKQDTTNTSLVKITDNLLQYKQADEEWTTPGTVYRGYVDKDGNWFIIKEVVAGTAKSIRFCKGDATYASNKGYEGATTGAWDARASLTYRHFHIEF